jgi:hypothetical protein
MFLRNNTMLRDVQCKKNKENKTNIYILFFCMLNIF